MNKPQYFLESERLLFRIWHENDLQLALALWGDPQVTKLFDKRGKLSEEQVRERLAIEIQNQKMYGVQYWPIFEKKTNNFIGAVGLRPKRLEVKQYEIGFHVCTRHWGKGYGFEATNKVITYAFCDLKALSLFAGHNPHNEASQHLLIKLGFKFTHNEFYEPTGLKHPSYELRKNKNI